jgi:multiple sugar transport system substrate-binding protein
MSTWKNVARAAVSALAITFAAGAAQAQDLLFWSTQGTPVEEAQRIRDLVLSGYDKPVEFAPQDAGPYFTRLQAELEAGKGAITFLGGLHGDFARLSNDLVDLTDIAAGLGDLKISPALMKLGKLGTGEQKYLPWMQATYIMMANKKALKYLPEGADIQALTYDQLIAWAKAMKEGEGSPKFGIPAGPQGLIHRFFQGYLYPSFTNSMVTKFRSAEAEAMWNTFKTLWAETTPASTSYGFMQEPLLTEDVWVAWDHTARLGEAMKQRPDDFVAFPTGRGFMPVVAGVAVPRTSNNIDEAKKLVAYMMQPTTQVAQLRANGFYPSVQVTLPDDLPVNVRAFGAVIAAQAGAADANPGLLPVGLGEFGGQFNKVYVDTFQRIILAGQDVRQVLDSQAQTLKSLMERSGAPCWAPDPASEGACPVE